MSTPIASPPAADLSNAALLARRHAVVARGVGQAHPLFVDHARNAEFWDVEQRRYIDFAGGIGVLNTGHCHPDVIAAVCAQLDRYTHTCFQVVAYEPYVALAERLTAMAPGAFAKKAVLLSTGAEAVENAIKIARAYTGRPGVIAFDGGFHGRTLMTLGLTAKVAPYKAGFGPFPADMHHARFPDELRGVSSEQALESVRALFTTTIEAQRVAAFVLEPVQGEGGFLVAPPEFVRGLRALADEHGIVLIADEVQCGAGRTGTWFASERWPVAPDLITLAKSMAGGFPISAVLGRAQIMDAPGPGGLGGTYAGSPLGCAAGLAVLEVFEREGLLARAELIGTRMREGLQRIAEKHGCISDIRGLGAMIAAELGEQGDPLRPAPALTARVIAAARERGLILLSCGREGNVLRLMVPLTAPDALVEEGMSVLAACFDEVCAA